VYSRGRPGREEDARGRPFFRTRFDGDHGLRQRWQKKTDMLNGPCAGTREQPGGCYIIGALDRDTAVDWAARAGLLCATSCNGGG
jgi:hypothetical protein